MTPAEQAKALCEARGGNFKDEVEWHMLHGFVYCSPTNFAMIREQETGAGPGWFCWLVVGRLKDVLPLLPYPLPWIGWCRQGRGWKRDHWVRTDQIVSRLA